MPASDAVVEAVLPSPGGDLTLEAGAHGLRYLGFNFPAEPGAARRLRRPNVGVGSAAARLGPRVDRPVSESTVGAGLKPASPGGTPHHPIIAQAEHELAEYFAGIRRRFTIPLDLAGTDFQLRIWRILLEIPYGTTITYRELAAAAGRPSAIRAAGAANGANPISIIVPCHRVIGSDGSLTGYAGGIETKRFLIELERSVVSGAETTGLSPVPLLGAKQVTGNAV